MISKTDLVVLECEATPEGLIELGQIWQKEYPDHKIRYSPNFCSSGKKMRYELVRE